MVSADKEREATLESLLYIYHYSNTKKGKEGIFHKES